MSDTSAQTAWEAWADPAKSTNPAMPYMAMQRVAFVAGYVQALLDAADAQEQLASGPRALGSKAVAFKRLLFTDWLRSRAADAGGSDE